jgi:hypothetical protein
VNELERFERMLLESLSRGDIDAAATLLREDFLITTAGWIAKPVGKQAWLEALFPPDAFGLPRRSPVRSAARQLRASEHRAGVGWRVRREYRTGTTLHPEPHKTATRATRFEGWDWRDRGITCLGGCADASFPSRFGASSRRPSDRPGGRAAASRGGGALARRAPAGGSSGAARRGGADLAGRNPGPRRRVQA